MHEFASIMYLSSPCDMHSTGHSAAHAPQDIHLSVILYAITYSPTFTFFGQAQDLPLQYLQLIIYLSCGRPMVAPTLF